MRAILCVALVSGCSADCATLAARYAQAFHDAQQCEPGKDVCTYVAAAVDVADLPDGGGSISIDACINPCHRGNASPAKAVALAATLDEYRSQCQHAARCLCAIEPPGPDDTCRPTA